jgi:hypothetical protein
MSLLVENSWQMSMIIRREDPLPRMQANPQLSRGFDARCPTLTSNKLGGADDWNPDERRGRGAFSGVVSFHIGRVLRYVLAERLLEGRLV